MCRLLVGLPTVTVLGVADLLPSEPIAVHIETVLDGPGHCPGCGTTATIKDRATVTLVDLPVFGRPARLVWRKRRWCCPDRGCSRGSWTETAPAIAAPRLRLTDRAGRWVTEQVGRLGRTVSEVARELGCDWHTVNDTVIAYGRWLVDDPARIGQVTALGLDEVLFTKRGRWRTKHWSTSIVDVAAGQLLDVVEGRNAAPARKWLKNRDAAWRARIRYGTLDMSGPYRKVFTTELPKVTLVADPFHVHKVRREAPCNRGRVRDPTRRPVAAGR